MHGLHYQKVYLVLNYDICGELSNIALLSLGPIDVYLKKMLITPDND